MSNDSIQPNETIELMNNHRSIRKFKNTPVSRDRLLTIISAAQMASTSSNMQAYSIIHVTDANKKRELASLAGNQVYVETCPVFLVWCADLNRLKTACKLDPANEYIGTTENLIVSLVDTALVAQNAAIAAESLGLGMVFIGGIRNKISEVAELLALPKLVIPVFGMCLGYPDQSPLRRERLPGQVILHENVYDASQLESQLEEYDAKMRQYMVERTNGVRNNSWTDDIVDKLSKPSRMHMRSFLQKQGFWDNEMDTVNT